VLLQHFIAEVIRPAYFELNLDIATRACARAAVAAARIAGARTL